MSENLKQVAVAIIGFNRPDFIQLRLQELEKILDKFETYIALDGPREDKLEDIKAQDEIRELLGQQRYSSVKIIQRDLNYGCDKHIPLTIGELLNVYRLVLVIEDDVRIMPQAAVEMINKMILNEAEGKSSPVLGISSIARNSFQSHNRWRTSRYFSAWGYVLSRTFWEVHLKVQSKASQVKEFDELVLNSEFWKDLSSRRQRLWKERFLRGNYDYQIQQTLFVRNIETSSPVFRILSNQGHADTRASHTRFKQPLYLKRKIQEANYRFRYPAMNVHWAMSSLLNFLDSNTWAGDGIFSVRGRTAGFRTISRTIFRKVFPSR